MKTFILFLIILMSFPFGSNANVSKQVKEIPKNDQELTNWFNENSQTIVLGSLDPDIIRSHLFKDLDKFSNCFKIEVGKGYKGKLETKLDFTIDGAGKVTRTSSKAMTYISDDFLMCIEAGIKEIRFTAPSDGKEVEVIQKMNFSN